MAVVLSPGANGDMKTDCDTWGWGIYQDLNENIMTCRTSKIFCRWYLFCWLDQQSFDKIKYLVLLTGLIKAIFNLCIRKEKKSFEKFVFEVNLFFLSCYKVDSICEKSRGNRTYAFLTFLEDNKLFSCPWVRLRLQSLKLELLGKKWFGLLLKPIMDSTKNYKHFDLQSNRRGDE